MDSNNKNGQQPTPLETFEATGIEQEAILSRMAPNDRAHYESLLQKYREGKTAQWQEDKLRKAGLIVSRTEPAGTSNAEHLTSNTEIGNPELVVPSYADSAAELAKILDTYFRARISIEITPTLVGLWRKGLRVGAVFIDGQKMIPPSLPKNKSGNRFETKPCIEWVEKWIVPQKSVRNGDGSSEIGVGGPGTAQDFDRIKQEDEIWWINHNRAMEEGKFKSVEVFNQHLTSFGLAVNRAINESEKGLRKAILAEIEKLGVRSLELGDGGGSDSGIAGTAENGALRQQCPTGLIEDAVARGVRAEVDGLRESVARAVLDAGEPTTLTTDEHQ